MIFPTRVNNYVEARYSSQGEPIVAVGLKLLPIFRISHIEMMIAQAKFYAEVNTSSVMRVFPDGSVTELKEGRNVRGARDQEVRASYKNGAKTIFGKYLESF